MTKKVARKKAWQGSPPLQDEERLNEEVALCLKRGRDNFTKK